MSLDLNMTEVSRDVFPQMVAIGAPVLECARTVSKDPYAKTTEVLVPTAVTARKYTQSDNGHTTDSAHNTRISVDMIELYSVLEMNQLQAGQTPVDVVGMYTPLLGAALGLKMFEEMNALVTAGFYTNAPLVSTAANFDSVDLATSSRVLSVAKAPKEGRFAVLDPNYTEYLKRDTAVSAAYAFGDDSVIKENNVERVRGFRIHEVTDVAASSDVASLEGWMAAPSAFAVAFSPKCVETPWAPSFAARGSFTDRNTGITVTTKVWDNNLGKVFIGAYIGFGIARGLPGALQILRSVAP